MNAQIKLTLVKSPIGRSKSQRETLKCLRLRKIRQESIFKVDPCVLGMIKKVNHLIKVEKI